MIIWINGGFGSGKTQTSYELQKRLEKAYVFDPENVGFYIRSNIPHDIKTPDFQDYPVWRQMTTNMLRHTASAYDGIVLCPMTVTNINYLNEILNPIENEFDIKHFTLTVTKETLEKRLKARGEKKNAWAFDQVERCVTSLSNDAFKEHIHTDEMTIDQVVEEIAHRCNLKLKNDTRSNMRKKLDRIVVWKKHVRLLSLFR